MSPAESDERPFSEDRWVRIMCDCAADGVWDIRGAAGSPDELPIPAELQGRILAWQAWYEQRNPFAGEEGEPEDDFDVAAFSAEGLAIARAVKAALPDWTVIYFDEAKSTALPFGSPRPLFEFEITSELASTPFSPNRS